MRLFLFLLQSEFYALASELEVDPLGCRYEVDYDTVLVLHRRDAGSTTNCALCRSASVSSVEVAEFLQVRSEERRVGKECRL